MPLRALLGFFLLVPFAGGVLLLTAVHLQSGRLSALRTGPMLRLELYLVLVGACLMSAESYHYRYGRPRFSSYLGGWWGALRP